MPATLDDLMETASRALADMDYARCEALCLDALAQARAAEDWVMVRRVLLPLQEARRQKRQAAIDGLILLGTTQRFDEVSQWIADPRCGCVVLTRPCEAADAAALDALIRDEQRAVEVLFADSEPGDKRWRITTFRGPRVAVEVPAPKGEWAGQWIDPMTTTPPTPAHWFMHASECLGDALLVQVDAPLGGVERFDALAEALASASDHEILHQRLADAAKALQGATR